MNHPVALLDQQTNALRLYDADGSFTDGSEIWSFHAPWPEIFQDARLRRYRTAAFTRGQRPVHSCSVPTEPALSTAGRWLSPGAPATRYGHGWPNISPDQFSPMQ